MHLRLRSKLYLFSKKANFILKSLFPYQFLNFFIAVIRTRSRDSTIAMSIILDHHDTTNVEEVKRECFFFLKNILYSLDMFHDI